MGDAVAVASADVGYGGLQKDCPDTLPSDALSHTHAAQDEHPLFEAAPQGRADAALALAQQDRVSWAERLGVSVLTVEGTDILSVPREGQARADVDHEVPVGARCGLIPYEARESARQAQSGQEGL